MNKANKQEMELRAGFAADLLAQGHSCTVVTTRVTEEYALSRRQARRITAKAMDLIVQDFEEINIERPQMDGGKTTREARARYAERTHQ